MENKNELAYLVSNYDIEKKFNHSKAIKVIIYSDLQYYNDIYDLLDKNISACFILLRTSVNSGHWCCLVRNNKNIYYFDSYGVGPDGELSRISKGLRYQLGESDKLLTGLIQTITSDYTFSYNNIQFQQYLPDINTCGKWTTVFTKCVFLGMTLIQFQNKMKELKNEYKTTYDDLICVLYDAF
jgi:hypothetical protein